MSKLVLIGACAALALSACNYNSDYNKEGYNSANANYSAEDANYSGNAAGYGNATDYNAVNAANTTEDATNATGNAGNAAANSATNNGY